MDMKAVPVYRYPAAYAVLNEETDQYRASSKANVACKTAIESAIWEFYSNNTLNPLAIDTVTSQFGEERVKYVLAVTVRHKDWDARFTPYVRQWANTIQIFYDDVPWKDSMYRYVVNSHPGLTNLFIEQMLRMEACNG